MRSDAPSLEELLQRVGRGDRAALRPLYDRAAPRLLGIAIRMLGRRDMAEEALQETFVAAWTSAARFDPNQGRAEAWLATILRRKAIDRLRASPWLRTETGLPEALPAPAERTASLALRECLDRIGEKYRRALLFVYYFGLTHDELSQRLDAPAGTVKSWVRRGLIAMRDCLEA